MIKESLRVSASGVTSRLPVVHPHVALRYKDWEIPAGVRVHLLHGSIILQRAE
jgi:hypothetical protein